VEGLALLLEVVGIVALALLLLRLQRRATGRRGKSALGPFLRHFEAEGVPPEVAAAAFRQLERWMLAQDRSFAVRPEQDLVSVYGLVPQEIEAALDRLAEECGRRRDPARSAPKLASVADLVAELARWPIA
jgi:hypothetical protein